MKMYVVTENGDLVHTLRHIEQYDVNKKAAQSDIIDFVVEAQKTAKFFCERKPKEMIFTDKEREAIKKINVDR